MTGAAVAGPLGYRFRVVLAFRAAGVLSGLVRGFWLLLLWLASGGLSQLLLSPLWAAFWRRREYAADAFAEELGQGEELARFLDSYALFFDVPVPFLWASDKAQPRSSFGSTGCASPRWRPRERADSLVRAASSWPQRRRPLARLQGRCAPFPSPAARFRRPGGRRIAGPAGYLAAGALRDAGWSVPATLAALEPAASC